MNIASITKLVIAVLIVVTVAILAFFSKIAEQAVTALLGAVIGYILGNGQAVLQSNKTMLDIATKAIESNHNDNNT